ncbi:MAG: hypothetical protein ACXACP_08645, partial [Candidatus Hodarchaeales archaeon]
MAKKYYCGLCETSHNALKPRHQCNVCARFYCDSALEDARKVGVTTCVFCDSDLSPFFLTTKDQDLTEDKVTVDSDSINDHAAIYSDSSSIQENVEFSSEIAVSPSYDIEINPTDIDLIRLIQEMIKREIPLLENEEKFRKNFGFIVRNQRIVGLSLFKHEI